MSVQVIVKHGDRSWDAIRPDERMALYQVGVHMEKDDDLTIFIIGRSIADRISQSKDLNTIKDWVTSRGCVITIKELNQGEQ